MTVTDEHSALLEQLIEVVDTVMTEARPRLLEAAFTRNAGEQVNTRHADNFLSEHDVWLHHRYLELLCERVEAFVYASEEGDPVEVAGGGELVLLVDPLDTSELAVRALNGYTQVLAYSRSLRRPVAAVVGDVFHHVRFYAAAQHGNGRDRAFLQTAEGSRRELSRRLAPPINEALVTAFTMKPAERLRPLLEQERFLEALEQPSADGTARGRLGLDFGSVGLCHVAAGFTDAVIEFAKGFALWDLAPGHYVLHAAGGAVVDLGGAPLSLDLQVTDLADLRRAMSTRRRFVAAADAPLAAALSGLLSP